MKKRWIVLAVYLILVVVCAVIIYVVPPVAGLFEKTYIAEYGTLEVADDVEALVIRDDNVYLSKKAGEVNRLVEPGTLVRTGCKILELSGEGNDEVPSRYGDALERLGSAVGKSEGGTQKAGYVTFCFDGYESTLNNKRASRITYEQFKDVSDRDIEDMSDKKVAKGEPISRITSNGTWYLLFYVDKDRACRYIKGYDVNIIKDDETVTGKVVGTKDEQDMTRVLVSCKMRCKWYLNTRKTDVKIVSSDSDGVILNKESLVTINKQQGVIVLDKVGDKYFKPVKIKSDDGEKVAVYEDLYMDDNNEFVETINNYDEVLSKPSEDDVKTISAAMKASADKAEE